MRAHGQILGVLEEALRGFRSFRRPGKRGRPVSIPPSSAMEYIRPSAFVSLLIVAAVAPACIVGSLLSKNVIP